MDRVLLTDVLTEDQSAAIHSALRRTRRLRSQHVRTRTSDDGRHSVAFGIRFGYWPCPRGPFLQLAVGTHRFDLWHGLPSYRGEDGHA